MIRVNSLPFEPSSRGSLLLLEGTPCLQPNRLLAAATASVTIFGIWIYSSGISDFIYQFVNTIKPQL